MAGFPVPLDNLINYVQALHPDGGPMDRVSDAVSVSADLSEESDALLGHFVDQARRSGATWNEIGEAMGVTKQAAQKRFVPGRHGDFSRFTERARITMASARLLAGDSDVSAAHLGSATLLDPAGIAAKMVGRAGLTPGQVYAALGTAAPAQPPAVDATPAGLADLATDGSGRGGTQVRCQGGAAVQAQLHRHRAPAARRHRRGRPRLRRAGGRPRPHRRNRP